MLYEKHRSDCRDKQMISTRLQRMCSGAMVHLSAGLLLFVSLQSSVLALQNGKLLFNHCLELE